MAAIFRGMFATFRECSDNNLVHDISSAVQTYTGCKDNQEMQKAIVISETRKTFKSLQIEPESQIAVINRQIAKLNKPTEYVKIGDEYFQKVAS